MPQQGGTDTLNLGEILVAQQYIGQDELDRIVRIAAQRGIDLRRALLEERVLTRQLLGQAIAEHLQLQFADLEERPPAPDMVTRIPETLARQFHVVLFSEEGDTLTVATDETDHHGMTDALRGVFGDKKFARAYAPRDEVEALFVHYRKPLAGRLAEVSGASDLPAPSVVEEVIKDALTLGASDIHIEPRADGLQVRFRVDGVMHEAVRLDASLTMPILNRIKVLSRMRLDDHFSAQDGAIRHESDGEPVDIRVSIVPTVDGEKIVMRLLTGNMSAFGLGDLGMEERHISILNAAVKKPFGMILVTGPTGSGKTTTLYGVLKNVNTVGVNITTIEDPVEYRLTGVNQIQVNPQTGLTFEQGLRAIVRQNPDIILVGEIRDRDTAEIAVNSALTGHMLYSTFHANDAATAVPRLLEIGLEPFLMSSTLELIIAQRLVRRICESCRTATVHTKAMLEAAAPGSSKYFGKGSVQLYKGKGCTVCHNIGYRGRTGVFEFLQVSKAMRDLILRRPSSQAIWQLARSEGAVSLFEDGVAKVKAGVTTLEELTRVASPA
jgi:type IV pilus assembly protein PilB